jgi:hypothetical protein
MAKQKRDLADAMEADLSAEPVSTTKGPVKEAPQKKRPAWQRPSRKNTQLLGAHFDPAVGRQLEMLRAELQIKRKQKLTVKAMLADALNMYFKTHGKPPIAE